MFINAYICSGLGTGIAASAFIQHGLSTTVVDIDTAVYEAAKTYFGFQPSDPKKVFISDARGWVLSRTHSEQTSYTTAPEERAPEETFERALDLFSMTTGDSRQIQSLPDLQGSFDVMLIYSNAKIRNPNRIYQLKFY